MIIFLQIIRIYDLVIGLEIRAPTDEVIFSSELVVVLLLLSGAVVSRRQVRVRDSLKPPELTGRTSDGAARRQWCRRSWVGRGRWGLQGQQESTSVKRRWTTVANQAAVTAKDGENGRGRGDGAECWGRKGSAA